MAKKKKVKQKNTLKVIREVKMKMNIIIIILASFLLVSCSDDDATRAAVDEVEDSINNNNDDDDDDDEKSVKGSIWISDKKNIIDFSKIKENENIGKASMIFILTNEHIAFGEAVDSNIGKLGEKLVCDYIVIFSARSDNYDGEFGLEYKGGNALCMLYDNECIGDNRCIGNEAHSYRRVSDGIRIEFHGEGGEIQLY